MNPEDRKQTKLGTEEDDCIPSRSEINEKIGENYNKNTYQTYFKPYFEILQNSSEGVTTEELYDQVDKNVKEKTKEDYLKDVFEYQPELLERVVDLNPSTEAFLDRSLERKDLDIKPDTINDVKEACEELSDQMKGQYLDHHIEQLKETIEKEAGIIIPEEGEISVETHNRFVHELLNKVGDELPETLDSFDQSIVKIGGTANEKIVFRSLSHLGLEEGEHFEDVSEKNNEDGYPEDLRVKTKSDNETLYVEIKSNKSRERGSTSLSRIENPSILFGYFDSQKEIAGSMRELIDESIAVYAPPGTLEEMSDKNPDQYKKEKQSDYTSRNDSWLFFRANTEFFNDMEYYYHNGELPELSLGHEKEYL